MPAQDNADSEAYAVLLELKEVPDHPLNKYKGDEADATLNTPDATNAALSIFCANHLPALVDKFLEPPPSPQLSKDLQEELKLNSVYFQMLFFLQQMVHPYWLKYLRSKKESASKNIDITRVMVQRVLKVVPIWLGLNYPIVYPAHWPSDEEGFFSAIPPSSQVLWMLSSLLGGIIREATQDDILSPELKTDLRRHLAQWAQYREPRFSRACGMVAEKLTPDGSRLSKMPNLTASGLRQEWHTCGLRSCHLQDEGRFKICGRCRTVRYCSEAHQKQHWKAEHKHRCFETSY